MKINSDILLEILKDRHDSYLIGYRWRFKSVNAAFAQRRKLLKKINAESESIIVHSISTDNEISLEKLALSIVSKTPPIPSQVSIYFFASPTEVELFIAAHHSLLDGTAFWNIVRELMLGKSCDTPSLLEELRLSKSELSTLERARALIQPTRDRLQWTSITIRNPHSKYISAEILMDIATSLSETLNLKSIVSPKRLSDDGARYTESRVEYEPLIDDDARQSGQGSLTLDTFPILYPLPAMEPLGAYPLLRRTDCDCLIEELGRDVKISATAKEQSMEKEAIKVIDDILTPMLGCR